MSDRIEGSGAAAVGAHSKDAMEAAHGTPGRPVAAPMPPRAGGGEIPGGSPARQAGEVADQTAAKAGEAWDKTTDKAGETWEQAGDKAEEVAASASRMAREAGDSLTRVGGQAYRQSSEAAAQTGDYVSGVMRNDPLLALLGAGAVGFALGLLIGRR